MMVEKLEEQLAEKSELSKAEKKVDLLVPEMAEKLGEMKAVQSDIL